MKMKINSLEDLENFLISNEKVLTSDQIKKLVVHSFGMYLFEVPPIHELINKLRIHENTPLAQKPLFL